MAEAGVAGVGAVAALVVVPVGDGHQEAGCRVQPDAEAPDVALRGLAPDGRADGGQVVGDLQGDGGSGRRGEPGGAAPGTGTPSGAATHRSAGLTGPPSALSLDSRVGEKPACGSRAPRGAPT